MYNKWLIALAVLAVILVAWVFWGRKAPAPPSTPPAPPAPPVSPEATQSTSAEQAAGVTYMGTFNSSDALPTKAPRSWVASDWRSALAYARGLGATYVGFGDYGSISPDSQLFFVSTGTAAQSDPRTGAAPYDLQGTSSNVVVLNGIHFGKHLATSVYMI